MTTRKWGFTYYPVQEMFMHLNIFLSLENQTLTTRKLLGDWRGGSPFQSSFCFCRGLEFRPQYPHQVVHTAYNSSSRGLNYFLHLHAWMRKYTHCLKMNTFKKNTSSINLEYPPIITLPLPSEFLITLHPSSISAQHVFNNVFIYPLRISCNAF